MNCAGYRLRTNRRAQHSPHVATHLSDRDVTDTVTSAFTVDGPHPLHSSSPLPDRLLELRLVRHLPT